ncbi:hypothetical protein IWQ60_000179 [Tieghemiomyces parasiticus]|uniref:Ammonium transporter n=1 Tax=Tieghemiomyces parasiticus TaxID=78921 RepID=A0A9W8AGD0_9FUNG|nr:hypothetical protein IWQ60_000179 [Tieghemiomyces parasiticus]
MSEATLKPVDINSGDTAWVLASACLVFIMIPGLGYFYSGMATGRSALSMIFLCMLSLAIVPIQWYIWGYSLALSPTGGKFIGNLDHAFLRGVGPTPHPNAPNVPGTVYAIFQCMFSALTPALALGATAERVRLLPALIFLFVWSTVVYDPIAYWTWGTNGFLRYAGSLDYAGGTPVHMASGFAALAYAMVLGKRRAGHHSAYQPHNFSNIMLGTALLWFGWFGFNGGSGVLSNSKAGQAMIVTHLAASVGGVTWMLWQYRYDRKFSSFGFCCGAVAGLVAITPGSGYVTAWAALVYGVVAGTVCHFAVVLKDRYWFDDALDVFAVHGVGGVVGNLLTGLFASAAITAVDGTEIPGGWIDGHYKQLLVQLFACGAGGAWSFVVTYIILRGMDLVPFLRVRVSEADEERGVDITEMGEDYFAATVKPDPLHSADGMPLSEGDPRMRHNSDFSHGPSSGTATPREEKLSARPSTEIRMNPYTSVGGIPPEHAV